MRRFAGKRVPIMGATSGELIIMGRNPGRIADTRARLRNAHVVHSDASDPSAADTLAQLVGGSTPGTRRLPTPARSMPTFRPHDEH